VEHGPLPPHEREWRHPSELGPPAHEPTTRSGRVLIASTATLGLLLVGALAITMTPRRSASPMAASSTALGLRAAPASTTDLLPIVTPIGDDGWGVTTAAALVGARGQRAQVQLASGEVVQVSIERTTDDVTVVSLPAGIEPDSFDVSSADPSGDDTVVLLGDDEPVAVQIGELANVDVAEATPVLDEGGRLLGLATGEPDARWMLPVETVPASPATSTTAFPATSTTTPETAITTTTTPTTTTTSTTTTSTTAPPTTVTAPPTTAAPATAPPSSAAAPASTVGPTATTNGAGGAIGGTG